MAAEKCQQEKRKTVNGENILFAMTSLGFEHYAEALKIYLAKIQRATGKSSNGNTRGPKAQNAGKYSTGGQGLRAAQRPRRGLINGT